MPKDDMGWQRMPLDIFLMLQYLLLCFDIAQGWHGMSAGCLPHLKHAFCIEIASKSIWDDTGWHWTMCPAKNMKFRVWFPKDDMRWHRMTIDALHCKNTPFVTGNAQGWHGMTQDDTRHISCYKTFFCALILHRDDMVWHAVCIAIASK
jgi:hypothetical protein